MVGSLNMYITQSMTIMLIKKLAIYPAACCMYGETIFTAKNPLKWVSVL